MLFVFMVVPSRNIRQSPRLRVLQEKRADILRIAERRGGRNVRIFGSVAKGEDSTQSDIDLLMVFIPGTTLFDRSGLLVELQDLLGYKVDVVSEKMLHPLVRQDVLSSAIPL